MNLQKKLSPAQHQTLVQLANGSVRAQENYKPIIKLIEFGLAKLEHKGVRGHDTFSITQAGLDYIKLHRKLTL